MRSPVKGSRRVWWVAITIAVSVIVMLARFAYIKFVYRADVIVGTASLSGIHYPLGGSICRLFNLDTPRHGLRCSEVASPGPVATIKSLRSGELDIGVVPSDVLIDAVSGQGPFAVGSAVAGLRTLFAGPQELFTVVARRDSRIRTAADLRGKRVNLGDPESRQRVIMERFMTALGLTKNDFAEVLEVSQAEQNRAFCANEIDVTIYSVSHPNGQIEYVTRICDGILVDAGEPGVDRIVSTSEGYERAVIAGGTYLSNSADVRTFGVRVAIIAGPRVSDTVAYEITKAAFDNLKDFQQLHPDFEKLSFADMVRSINSIPVHPGAARYFRERGINP